MALLWFLPDKILHSTHFVNVSFKLGDPNVCVHSWYISNLFKYIIIIDENVREEEEEEQLGIIIIHIPLRIIVF